MQQGRSVEEAFARIAVNLRMLGVYAVRLDDPDDFDDFAAHYWGRPPSEGRDLWPHGAVGYTLRPDLGGDVIVRWVGSPNPASVPINGVSPVERLLKSQLTTAGFDSHDFKWGGDDEYPHALRCSPRKSGV